MKKSLLSLLFLVLVSILSAQERVYTPTLKFPENNGLNQMPNVTISWYAITGSLNLQYQVQMDTTMLFNSPLKVDTTQLLLTGYKTHELFFGQKYFWRVRAIDGQTSAWSSVWNFTIFNKVELSKPDANAVDQDPNVSIIWLPTITTSKKPITGITHFDYQIDTDSSYNTPNLMQGTTTPIVLKVSTSNLHFGQKYFWRVRAGHHLGNSAYCPSRNFTVIDKFTLSSPVDNATKIFLNTLLKWKEVKGVLAYGYEIAKDQDFTEIVAASEVDTNFVLASYLKFGEKYYWRVRGRHLTDTSQWSTPYSFTTINTVDLKLPANLQENVALKPLLQWTKQTGIVSYELWLDSLSAFANPIVKFKPNANDIQYQVSKTLSPQKTYYWKMRAYSDGGLTADTSDWSPVWSFVTLNLTGIPENIASPFIVYPNPSNGKIFLKMESHETTTVQFELIDLLGKTLMEKTINLSTGQNLNEITLENVNNGIYVIRLRTGNGTINQKIFIEK
jgi:Secretion system C-terminal sorting domain